MLVFWKRSRSGHSSTARFTFPSRAKAEAEARACFGGDAAERPAESKWVSSAAFYRCGNKTSSISINFKLWLTDYQRKWRYPQPRICSWPREDEAAQWALRKITFTSTRRNWKTSQTTSKTGLHSRSTPRGPSGSIGTLFTHPTHIEPLRPAWVFFFKHRNVSCLFFSCFLTKVSSPGLRGSSSSRLVRLSQCLLSVRWPLIPALTPFTCRLLFHRNVAF